MTATMYDMSRVNANGYFDSENSEEQRYEKRKALNQQRTDECKTGAYVLGGGVVDPLPEDAPFFVKDYYDYYKTDRGYHVRSLNRTDECKTGAYVLGGGVVDPLPEDAPFFVKDYYDYYKTDRGYHVRSLNSNEGWNVTGCMSFLNMPILQYSNEIRSAVLMIHGEKAHSCYFSKDAFANMIKDNPCVENKELMIIPDIVHTDLYDGGGKNAIPFDKITAFFHENLK